VFFDWDHTVADSECDWLGHASNVAFVDWLQSAAVAHSAAAGWPTQRYLEYGSAFMVRSHQVTYLGQAQAGDLLRVRTWVEDLASAKCLRRYEIERLTDPPKLLARAQTIWAFVDLKRGIPRRIPEEIASRFPVRSRAPFSEAKQPWTLAEWREKPEERGGDPLS
jgi:acyl-CoA thioester hydrolase